MLEVSGLSKRYGKTVGVANATFRAKPGTAVAFIGPNGSGKSTIFNILGGVLKPDTGNYTLDGQALAQADVGKIGFLPEGKFLLPDFTPPQMLHFMCAMKKLHASHESINALMESYGITEYAGKTIRQLSQGMTKKVALACALLGQPQLLILDEPLNALDIQSVIQLKKDIAAHKEEGAIILLSSHILDFLDAIADEIVFLKAGKIVDMCANEGANIESLYVQHFME